MNGKMTVLYAQWKTPQPFDPAQFLRNLNDHMPTKEQNKLIFIEKTGHIYQGKHQEVADLILRQALEWKDA